MNQEKLKFTEVFQKVNSRNLKVAIIGLGYVGLPLARRCVQIGFDVIGIEIKEDKVRSLASGQSYIRHIPHETICQMNDSGRFRASLDFSLVATSDIVMICVPTPLGRHQEPDLSYVTSTMRSLSPHFRKGQLVCLESTTYPGTTDEEIAKPLSEKGWVVGEDVFVVFSPEREDPGNKKFHTQTIPKVVGGVTSRCTQLGVAFYSQIIDQVVEVSSARVAEMSKLLENIYRSVNIGLVNELKTVCDPMGINIWEVIRAASTKPFGFVPFYPGPGLGGHCIPIDPFYLTWKAREYGVHTHFIELAGKVNTSMPQWVVTKLTDALNDRKKSVRSSKILILGVAYKKNIDDYRESPALELIRLLDNLGAEVSYSDPLVVELNDPHDRLPKNYRSIDVSASLLREQDCVLIATDHDHFDYDLILRECALIVDTRGRYQSPNEKVVMG